MAPPAHEKSSRHEDYSAYLQDSGLKDSDRFHETVDRLSAWLEFLLHPETHDYDRECYGPFQSTGGTWVWQEQSERMYNYNVEPDEEYQFRSVLYQYKYSDFLDPLVAVATQQVERGDSLLAVGAAAAANIYWSGQKFTSELANFPAEWLGDAANQARDFVARLESVATQLNLIVNELKDLLPKYAMVIKAARVDLERAARTLVEKFEEKFATKPEGGISAFVKGFLLSTVATAAIAFVTTTSPGGAILGASVVTAWVDTLKKAGEEVFGVDDESTEQTEEKSHDIGQIHGYWWKEIAASYLDTKDGILRGAASAMNQLNEQMAELATRFESSVPTFTDSLPQSPPPAG